jgi:hypothetical protein
MLDYMEEKGNGLYIYHKEMTILKATMQTILNRWLMESCNTLENYLKQAKKMTQKRYLIPIYINEELMLIPIFGYKNKRSIYMNASSIKSYDVCHQDCVITFQSGRVLKIKKTCHFIEKQVKMIQLLKTSHKKTFSYRLFQSEF